MELFQFAEAPCQNMWEGRSNNDLVHSHSAAQRPGVGAFTPFMSSLCFPEFWVDLLHRWRWRISPFPFLIVPSHWKIWFRQPGWVFDHRGAHKKIVMIVNRTKSARAVRKCLARCTCRSSCRFELNQLAADSLNGRKTFENKLCQSTVAAAPTNWNT